MSDITPQILVVEDVADWRRTILGLLQDEHYDVQVTDSVTGAKELLKTNHFQLAILDMRLDETDEDNTDGLDLAEIIQQQSPGTKVIILTGYSTPERQARAMAPNVEGKCLVADFIEKRDSEHLIESVHRLLR